MSRVEELERHRGDRPGCCATCRIACVIASHRESGEGEAGSVEPVPAMWCCATCPCVIASHGEPGEVETNEPEPVGSVHLVATERTMPAALEAGDPPGRSSGRTSQVLDDLLDSLVPVRDREMRRAA